MSILDSLTALKVGRIVIDRFNEEMSKMNFTYKDFQDLQNDYEKIMRDLLFEAFIQGKNDVSQTQFDSWLDKVSAYEENAISTNSALNSPHIKLDESQAPKIHPQDVEIAQGVLGDISGCGDTHSQIKKEIDKDYNGNYCICGHLEGSHRHKFGSIISCRIKGCKCNQYAKDKLNATKENK